MQVRITDYKSSMMKNLFFAISILFILPANAQVTINDPHAEIRKVAEFQSIKISGGIDLLLTNSNQQAVVVSTRSGANDKIMTAVKNGVLFITVDSKLSKFTSKDNFKAYVSYNELKTLEASGASNIRFAEPVQLERLSISLSGASTLKGNFNVARLSMDLKGASEAVAGGTVEEFSIISSGASDVKAYQLKSKKAEIKTSGASDINIAVSDFLTVNASGASEVSYSGNPKTTITSTGASTVKQKN